MTTNYYLVINGVAGNYSDKLLTGAFQVDAFDFLASNSGRAASFASLHLTLNTQTLSALLSAQANGQVLADVSLVGESTTAGQPPITYSLNLADVQIADVAQTGSSSVAVTLDYDKIGLVTTSFNTDGSPQPSQSFGWDIANGQPTGPGTSLTTSGAGSVTPTAPMTYYLLIDGLNGGSGQKQHVGWFQLNDFKIDLGSTGTQGTFGPLSVTTQNEAALTSLLSDEGTGTHLKGVRIEGVPSTGAAVYDLNLADVLVRRVEDQQSGGYGITFDYSKVSLVTKGQDQTGAITPTGSFGWDVINKTPIDPASMPSLAVGAAKGVAAPSSYYLVINGVAGDYSDKLLTGAFQVSAFDFFTINTGSAQQQTNGSALFRPLKLTLNSKTIAALWSASASGQVLTNASVVGETTTSGGPQITYSLNLTDVLVVDAAQPASSGSGVDVALNYDQIGLVTKGSNPSGQILAPESFGWDIKNSQQTGPGPSLTNGGVGTVSPTVPTSYYLLIDGLNGGATDKNHNGWFQLSNFNIDLKEAIDAQTGGFGGSFFGLLSVTTSSDAALTSLLSDDATGTQLKGVRIEGVAASGAPVYDLNLADVLVKKVDDQQSGGYGIGFGYGEISLVTKGQDKSGSFVQTGSFGWDVVNGQPISPSSMPSLAVGAAKGTAAPTTYYLVINGVAGDYSDKALTGAFQVSAFDFLAYNTGSAQQNITGKASFPPLHLTLSSETLAALWSAQANGQVFTNASLVGTSTTSGRPQIAYSLNLANVLITDAAQKGSNSIDLTLDYNKIGLVTTAFDSTGVPLPSESFGWDVANSQSTDAGTSLRSGGAGTVAPTAPATYYLLIDGLNGGATDKNHNGWFQLSNFSIDLGNNGKQGTFGQLSVTTQSELSLTSLLSNDANGKHLTGVRIEGVISGGQAVYDLNLADVLVTKVDDQQSDGFGINFDYSKIALVTRGQDNTGQFSQTGSFGWDILNNAAIDPNSMPSLSVGQPCYCPGTLILTDRGEVPVEQLVIGDALVTMSGATRPIRWIGRRSYAGRFAFGKKHILPICFKAGALGKDLPRRDLWISPHHAMYLEGILIEAKDLVNGVSIVQAERVEQVVYFHIELDSHDVIIAEGALSESYIDDDNRNMFHNAQEYYAAYPDAAEQEPRYCAPRCDSGYAVEAVRQRIEKRAGLRTADDRAEIRLRGYVDRVGSSIEGWAQNVAYPEAPVCLDIYADGKLIGSTLANRYREDLERAGLGSGRHSFTFTPPQGLDLASHAIEVRRSFDGALLPRADTFAWRRRRHVA